MNQRNLDGIEEEKEGRWILQERCNIVHFFRVTDLPFHALYIIHERNHWPWIHHRMFCNDAQCSYICKNESAFECKRASLTQCERARSLYPLFFFFLAHRLTYFKRLLSRAIYYAPYYAVHFTQIRLLPSRFYLIKSSLIGYHCKSCILLCCRKQTQMFPKLCYNRPGYNSTCKNKLKKKNKIFLYDDSFSRKSNLKIY